MPSLNLSVGAQPRRLFCRTADELPFTCEIPKSIAFPCYIEDYGTYLLVFSAGLRMVIGVPESVPTSKETVAGTKRYGRGLTTLGDIDGFSISDIDKLSFNDITFDTADWMVLTSPAAKFGRLQTLGDFDRFTLGELDNLPLL